MVLLALNNIPLASLEASTGAQANRKPAGAICWPHDMARSAPEHGTIPRQSSRQSVHGPMGAANAACAREYGLSLSRSPLRCRCFAGKKVFAALEVIQSSLVGFEGQISRLNARIAESDTRSNELDRSLTE